MEHERPALGHTAGQQLVVLGGDHGIARGQRKRLGQQGDVAQDGGLVDRRLRRRLGEVGVRRRAAELEVGLADRLGHGRVVGQLGRERQGGLDIGQGHRRTAGSQGLDTVELVGLADQAADQAAYYDQRPGQRAGGGDGPGAGQAPGTGHDGPGGHAQVPAQPQAPQ